MKRSLPRFRTVLPLIGLTLMLFAISAAAQKIPDAPAAALSSQESAGEAIPP